MKLFATLLFLTALPALAETVTPAQTGHWKFLSEPDAMTDEEVLSVQVGSMEFLPAARGRPAGPAFLAIWCADNRTDVSIWFSGQFMASSSGHGQMDYRVDKADAASVNMEADSTHEFLVLYGGKKSIPFIKALFGGEKLLIRATPLNQQSIDVAFAISNLEEAVKPIREACNW